MNITVLDETGGRITGATVAVIRGTSLTAISEVAATPGVYAAAALSPARYSLRVEAAQFTPVTRIVEIRAGALTEVSVTLRVQISAVVDVAASLSVDRRDSLTGITLTAKDLAMLPSNEMEMLYRLLEMAGSRGRPGDIAIYVDGFRDFRRLPPKAAIELIQINAEPYSAEFAEPGTRRIEIITKPGSDNPFGEIKGEFNDEALNATDPFATGKPPLQRRSLSAYYMAPIVRGRSGFYAYGGRWETDENAIINATLLGDGLEPRLFRETLAATHRVNNVTVNTGYAVTDAIRLRGEYSFNATRARNQGLQGGLRLPDQGIGTDDDLHTGRVSFLGVGGGNAVYELRAEVREQRTLSRANVDATAIQVIEAFYAGANQQVLFHDRSLATRRIEGKVTRAFGDHTLKAGLQADSSDLSQVNRADFGGTYVFGADVERDASGSPVSGANGSSSTISPLENYRRTLLGLAGYGPSLFTISRGDPASRLHQWEGSAYLQNDWIPSSEFTLSTGLRYGAQTNLANWWHLAPRVGLAWAPANRGVIRAGTGLFYDRFDSSLTLDTVQFDGHRQRRIVVNRPNFFPEAPDQGLDARPEFQTVMSKAPGMRAPRQSIASLQYERELTGKLFGSVGYTSERGVHLPRLRDVNSPALPGTPRPDPGLGQLLQYESTGRSRRDELQLALRLALNTGSRIFTNYTLSSTRADGERLLDRDRMTALPADSRDLAAEFGPTEQDSRHRLVVSGALWLPSLWVLSPSFTAASGQPFNITTGLDNNGDTHFTDRPAFADVGEADAVDTRFGRFDVTPEPGDRLVSRNFGRRAATYTFDLSLSKVFVLGLNPEAGRTLTINIVVQNLLNAARVRGYNGVLLSPDFGRALTAEPGRRASVGLNVTF